MKRLTIALLLALCLATVGTAAAQETPTPPPTPIPGPIPGPAPTPVLQIGAGGIEPFPLPTPDPNATIDVSPLWDYGSLLDAIRSFLTVAALVERNSIMKISVLVAAFGVAMLWIVSMVRGRGRGGGEDV